MSERSLPTATAGSATARDRAEPRPDARDLALIALTVAGFAGFAVLTTMLLGGAMPAFDPPLRDAALRWKAWHDLWSLISEAANLPLVVIGVGIVVWLLWKGRRREAVLTIATLALVTAGSEGVKQLVHRPRPPESDTVVPGVIYSFPSGHELESITILGIVALLIWRSGAPRAVRVAVVIAVASFCAAVAVARVAIDAHWPSDVLGGVLGGVAVLALFTLLTRPDRGRPPATSDATPDG